MLKPRFRVNPDLWAPIFVTEDYIASPHWAFKKSALDSVPKNKRTGLKSLWGSLDLPQGRYCFSDEVKDRNPSTKDTPDINAVIPKDRERIFEFDTDSPLFCTVQGKEAANFVYGLPGNVIGVAARYVPLLQLGHAYSHLEGRHPILILAEPKPDSELIGVVMPCRVQAETRRIFHEIPAGVLDEPVA